MDPRPAADIMHKNTIIITPAATATLTVGLSSDAAAGLPQLPPRLISCQQYIQQKYNLDLQHPQLPCVAVKLSDQACRGKTDVRDMFIHYPLEFCRWDLIM